MKDDHIILLYSVIKGKGADSLIPAWFRQHIFSVNGNMGENE
jgi:hypothetical protein